MLGNLSIGSINSGGFAPLNLIINPEININQRAAASPTATTGYNYDRWYYDGSSLLQGIENLNVRNTTYVISWSGTATCSYSLNTASSSSQGGQSYTSITNGSTFTVSSLGSNNLWIKFSGTLTGLTNVYLVPSTSASIFVPRQYGTELALCQRYYDTNDGVGGIITPATAFTVRFAQLMRATPTVTTSVNAGTLFDVAVGAGFYRAQINAIAVFGYKANAEL